MGRPTCSNICSLLDLQKRGITYVIPRFPLTQRSKIRNIDPCTAQNMGSGLLKKRVPMDGPQNLLATAAITADISKKSKPIVALNKAPLKKAATTEKSFEAQFRKVLAGEQDEIDARFLRDMSRSSSTAPNNSLAMLVFVLFFVLDASSAYHNLGIRSSHLWANWITVFVPSDWTLSPALGINLVAGSYVGIQSLVAVFGSRHSVSSWIRISEAIAQSIRSLLGLPIQVYVDDWSICLPRDKALSFSSAIRKVFTLAGIPFSENKCKLAERVKILGLLFHGGLYPHLSVDKDRVAEITASIALILAIGVLSPDTAQNLVGRVQFVFCALAGASWSTLLRPLYRRANSPSQHSAITANIRLALMATSAIIADLPIRRIIFDNVSCAAPVLIYNDASWSPTGGYMCGIIVLGNVYQFWRLRVDPGMLHSSVGQRPINFLECLCVTVSLLVFADHFEGTDKWLHLFTDNEAAKAALLKFDSRSLSLRFASFLFLRHTSAKGLRSWLSRVPTDQNIADLPTRPERLERFQSCFPGLLEEVEISDDVLEWTRQALMLSSSDESPVFDVLLASLQEEDDFAVSSNGDREGLPIVPT